MRNSPKFSAAWLASLTPELQKKFLQGLTNDELTILLSEWSFWARDDQLPPEGNWTTWLLLGGRGAGKTRAGAEWIRMRVKDKNPMFAARHIALVGETLAAARSVMVEGPSGILSISPEHERPQFISSRNMLVWPNGAKAQLFSSTRPASLRGPQFDAAWCDELSKWQNDQMTWDMLQFGLRLGPRPRQAVTTTPRRTKLLISLLEDKNCIVSRARTVDNKANLAPSFLSEIVDRYKGSRLGRQELDAEMIDLEQSGLWSHALIDRQRCYDLPQFKRVIVSLDPAVGSGKRVDHCGIIVIGQCREGFAYVLADESRLGLTPLQWGAHIRKVYHQYDAGMLVAEINQGGDLIRELILRDAPHIRFRGVRAKIGKLARAEPIVALYERGMVFHNGRFEELEYEMLNYNGRGASPDRLDALVWGLDTIMVKPEPVSPHIRSLS